MPRLQGKGVAMSAVKKMAKDIIRKSLEPACEKVCDIMKFAPPGHFYSPVPGLEDFNMVHRHQDLEAATNSQHGIDFLKVLDIERGDGNDLLQIFLDGLLVGP